MAVACSNWSAPGKIYCIDERLVSNETVVASRWGSEPLKFSIKQGVKFLLWRDDFISSRCKFDPYHLLDGGALKHEAPWVRKWDRLLGNLVTVHRPPTRYQRKILGSLWWGFVGAKTNSKPRFVNNLVQGSQLKTKINLLCQEKNNNKMKNLVLVPNIFE